MVLGLHTGMQLVVHLNEQCPFVKLAILDSPFC